MSSLNINKKYDISTSTERRLSDDEYITYAVALAKKYGHISPGQLAFVANKQEGLENPNNKRTYEARGALIRSGLFRELSKQHSADPQVFELKQKILEEDFAETSAALGGFLASGVATILLATYGRKFFDSIKDIRGSFIPPVPKLQSDVNKLNNKSQILKPNQQELFKKQIQKISGKFMNDPILIDYFNKIRQLSNNKDVNSLMMKNDLNRQLQSYIINKLTDDEKKYVKAVIEFINS